MWENIQYTIKNLQNCVYQTIAPGIVKTPWIGFQHNGTTAKHFLGDYNTFLPLSWKSHIFGIGCLHAIFKWYNIPILLFWRLYLKDKAYIYGIRNGL